ncbi:MAG TPA: hypothetical protein VIL20_26355 [Sandaracinaceae bacterium]
MARELAARGAKVAVGSICRSSYRDAVDAIVQEVRSAFAAECSSARELECTVPVARSFPSYGRPCMPGATGTCGSAPLACDPIFEVCGVACDGDDDCRGAGLSDWTCDLRPLAELDPRFAGDERARGFCVAPSCP